MNKPDDPNKNKYRKTTKPKTFEELTADEEREKREKRALEKLELMRKMSDEEWNNIISIIPLPIEARGHIQREIIRFRLDKSKEVTSAKQLREDFVILQESCAKLLYFFRFYDDEDVIEFFWKSKGEAELKVALQSWESGIRFLEFINTGFLTGLSNIRLF